MSVCGLAFERLADGEQVSCVLFAGHRGAHHWEHQPGSLNALAFDAHAIAIAKGWYESPRAFSELVALAHSELSEALEAYRDSGSYDPRIGDGGKPEGVPSEIADVIIRVADMCSYLEIDLDRAVSEKMAFNRGRPHRHGGKVL